jgi:polyisoprenoid-binding protein YceI
MKTPLIVTAVALSLAAGAGLLPLARAAAPTEPQAGATREGSLVYDIDNVHSTVMFRVKHLDVGMAYGRFNKVSGKITQSAGNPKDSAIEISVQADSVDSNDAKRDEHLRSPDFLSAKEFPTIGFKSTKVEKRGEELVVSGDLTLHGVTKPITVNVNHSARTTDPMGLDRVGFEGRFEINPKDFQINYMVENEGMLGPGIQMIVSLEATRKP